jgi:hypothetical protein
VEGRKIGNLKNFAGNQWTNMDKQLDFVLHELNTSEKKRLYELEECKDSRASHGSFHKSYETRYESSTPWKRIKHALELSGMTADPTEQGSDEIVDLTLEIGLHLTNSRNFMAWVRTLKTIRV